MNSEANEKEVENKEYNADYGNYDGTVIIKFSDKTICCITIIGQIEGHYLLPDNCKTTKYEHLIPKLLLVDSSENIDGVLFILNTVGGDIEAGLALSELIRGMKKPTASLVLGGGHSVGIPLAVSTDKSFIVNTATMTVHPVRISGTVTGTPQTYLMFNNIQERIVKFVSDNSDIGKEQFRKLMLNTEELANDIGTILTGEEAVSVGIIDELGSFNDALKYLAEI